MLLTILSRRQQQLLPADAAAAGRQRTVHWKVDDGGPSSTSGAPVSGFVVQIAAAVAFLIVYWYARNSRGQPPALSCARAHCVRSVQCVQCACVRVGVRAFVVLCKQCVTCTLEAAAAAGCSAAEIVQRPSGEHARQDRQLTAAAPTQRDECGAVVRHEADALAVLQPDEGQEQAWGRGGGGGEAGCSHVIRRAKQHRAVEQAAAASDAGTSCSTALICCSRRPGVLAGVAPHRCRLPWPA